MVTISYPLSETAGVLDLGVPIVHKAMKCDHYFGILSNLHANDKAVPTDNKDKLIKPRPVIQMLNSKYKTLRSLVIGS